MLPTVEVNVTSAPSVAWLELVIVSLLCGVLPATTPPLLLVPVASAWLVELSDEIVMPWSAVIEVAVSVRLPLVSPTTAAVVCVIVDVAFAVAPAPTPPEIPSAVVSVVWVDCAPMSTDPDVMIVDPGLTTAVVELPMVALEIESLTATPAMTAPWLEEVATSVDVALTSTLPVLSTTAGLAAPVSPIEAETVGLAVADALLPAPAPMPAATASAVADALSFDVAETVIAPTVEPVVVPI